MADTAHEQLERVLYVLAAAALPGGATDAELADALGVSPGQAAQDITSLADRIYYHPPGGTAGADILVEEDRIQVIPRGGEHRPSRLTAREAAALALGLRSMALEASKGRRERLLALLKRMERFAARAAAPEALAADSDLPRDETVQEVLRRAAAERRACAVEYLKPDGSRARREVHPYALVHAERWWYVLGPDAGDGQVRLFRVDRVLTAELCEASFQVPAAFDARRYLDGGRAFAAAEGVPVATVRYGPRAAGWVRERWSEAEDGPDGSVLVRHRVADPEWLVSHVLQYGPDAELLEPPELRRRVAERLERVVRRWEAEPGG